MTTRVGCGLGDRGGGGGGGGGGTGGEGGPGIFDDTTAIAESLVKFYKNFLVPMILLSEY